MNSKLENMLLTKEFEALSTQEKLFVGSFMKDFEYNEYRNLLNKSKEAFLADKIDLQEHPSWHDTDAVRLSCLNDQGFETLSQSIRESLQFSEVDWGEHAIAINARHQASLMNARHSLTAALDTLGTSAGNPELTAIDLRDALDALGEIPGKVDTEDLLGVIFSSFCIGK